jgi:hypothetical protein
MVALPAETRASRARELATVGSESRDARQAAIQARRDAFAATLEEPFDAERVRAAFARLREADQAAIGVFHDNMIDAFATLTPEQRQSTIEALRAAAPAARSSLMPAEDGAAGAPVIAPGLREQAQSRSRVTSGASAYANVCVSAVRNSVNNRIRPRQRRNHSAAVASASRVPPKRARQRHRHDRAAADFALDRELAAVHFRQRLGERQAKARAVIVARELFFDLLERARQTRQMFGRDAAAGIDDAQRKPRRAAARMHHDRALIGELHGVREQVQQDLLHRAVVGLDLREFFRVDDDGEALLLGLALGEAHGLIDRDARIERARRQRQLVGLDLGHVENVVDQIEQVIAAVEDVGRVLLVLIGLPIGPNSSFAMISEKPITALSGVRSSWLMFARNVLLARLASSAFWRSSCASLASALMRYSWLSARVSASERRARYARVPALGA